MIEYKLADAALPLRNVLERLLVAAAADPLCL